MSSNSSAIVNRFDGVTIGSSVRARPEPKTNAVTLLSTVTRLKADQCWRLRAWDLSQNRPESVVAIRGERDNFIASKLD